MKFGFIAKHRGIWPVLWMCDALGDSRGGIYAWLTRPRSQRSRDDDELSAKVRASFLGSDRTYGARRVWRDLLTEGISCGLHRIERLMRLQALKARPRRRRLRPIWGSGRRAPSHPTFSAAALKPPLPTANGSLTSRMSGPRKAGSLSRPSLICSPGVWLAGR
jgi:transposase InsO family protein